MRRGLVWLGAAVCAIAAAAPSARAQERQSRAALIDDLVAANHILYRQGVLDGFGHVSVRDPDNPGRFLMSRALAPGRVGKDDIMAFDLDAQPIDGKDRPIYSERFIHAEIYRARADVNAVVHSHSPSVIPFSVTTTPLKAIASTAAFLCAGAPVFEIRNAAGMTNLLISTGAIGKALAQTLGANAVALLRGHGDVVVGPELRVAVSRAIYTEIDARLELQAVTLGGPINYLAPEECAKIDANRSGIARGSEHGTDRIWGMWMEEARGAPAR